MMTSMSEPGDGTLTEDGRLSDELKSRASLDAGRNEVFERLVFGDSDIVGLVAYSLYKQNKRDWLVAFDGQGGRAPDNDELVAYTIGESTPRRLAAYRYLAEETLDGSSPTTSNGAERANATRPDYSAALRHKPQSRTPPRANWGVIGLVGLAVVSAIGIFLVVHYGFDLGTKKN